MKPVKGKELGSFAAVDGSLYIGSSQENASSFFGKKSMCPRSQHGVGTVDSNTSGPSTTALVVVV